MRAGWARALARMDSLKSGSGKVEAFEKAMVKKNLGGYQLVKKNHYKNRGVGAWKCLNSKYTFTYYFLKYVVIVDFALLCAIAVY